MINKPIAALTASDLGALVTNKVAEGRHLEFKRELPGTNEKDRIELCADVSSLANTGGGYLLFGVVEIGSTAFEVPGLPGVNIDQAILRLEQTLGSGIDPPVQGITTRNIPTSAGGDVIAVRVPRSWRAPHLVKHNDWFRLYVRASKGKQLLDAREVRRVFESAGDVVGAIRRWRDDRLATILGDDTPILLQAGSKAVLHVVPLESVADPYRLEVSRLTEMDDRFRTLGLSGGSQRNNLDGRVIHDGFGDTRARAYCQVFRAGRIESVHSPVGQENQKGQYSFGDLWFEELVFKAAWRYIDALTTLGMSYPMVVMLSLLGAKGVRMATRHDLGHFVHPIDRDVLVLPEVVLEEEPTDLPRAMRPISDAVWNACGLARSFSYDKNGNWADGELRGVPMTRVE